MGPIFLRKSLARPFHTSEPPPLACNSKMPGAGLLSVFSSHADNTSHFNFLTCMCARKAQIDVWQACCGPSFMVLPNSIPAILLKDKTQVQKIDLTSIYREIPSEDRWPWNQIHNLIHKSERLFFFTVSVLYYLDWPSPLACWFWQWKQWSAKLTVFKCTIELHNFQINTIIEIQFCLSFPLLM